MTTQVRCDRCGRSGATISVSPFMRQTTETLPAVEVTEEMIKAGIEAFSFNPDFDFEEDVVRHVYIAMRRSVLKAYRIRSRNGQPWSLDLCEGCQESLRKWLKEYQGSEAEKGTT